MFPKESQVRQAEIVVIGNEVTSGLIEETNSRTISLRLNEAGLDVVRMTAVGDDEASIVEAVEQALQRVDIVVTTGGLGATHDDITKHVLASFFGCGFKEDKKVLAMIENFFQKRGRKAPEYAFTQCSVPDKAVILYNEHGTAPGLLFHRDGKKLFALPGIPSEMEYLLGKYVIPEAAAAGGMRIGHRTLKTTGISESGLWEKIGSIESLGPKVASLPSHLGVNIRISAFGKEDLAGKLDAAERFFREKISDYIYGTDDETLEGEIGGLLRSRNLKLAVAESCTGGLIGHRITNVSGSSDYFLESRVVYGNEAKITGLGVEGKLLKQYGAVSREVAVAMAEGVRKTADVSLAVTGIAGPEGGSKQKPIGLTYIALNAGEGSQCEKFVFPHDRVRNKERAAQAALNLLWLWLLKNQK